MTANMFSNLSFSHSFVYMFITGLRQASCKQDANVYTCISLRKTVLEKAHHWKTFFQHLLNTLVSTNYLQIHCI